MNLEGKIGRFKITCASKKRVFKKHQKLVFARKRSDLDIVYGTFNEIASLRSQ